VSALQSELANIPWTMKRSKKPAAKNSLAPTMKSRARTKHAIQNEHALAEWAPQLWAADYNWCD
jgi:hypothetical protein